MDKNKIVSIYSHIGKAILCCAGAIVGFVTGGPFMALAGILIAYVAGHIVERLVAHPALK